MRNQIKISLRVMVLIGGILLTLGNTLQAENLKNLVDLRGNWKFSIGDNPEWSKQFFDDANWDNVIVPRSWEENGYRDYNGFGWYRKSFKWSGSVQSGYVMLCLGRIDDADEVYINGKLVGASGKMAPKPESAFEVPRRYAIPVSMLKSENTIAVRVYDYYMDGGIFGEKIGLFTDAENDLLELNLSGYWYFETEAELKQRKADGSKYKRNRIFVPATWESQGYNGYDGKAIYKTKFTMPKHLANEDLVLVLGFIDDVEVVYLNKGKIGSIISYEKEKRTGLSYHLIFRGYAIPKEHLTIGGDNLITVVIHDKEGLGGIYEGPIGITTREKYERLNELNIRYQSSFELFLNSFKR